MSAYNDDKMLKAVEKGLGVTKVKPYLEHIAVALTKNPHSPDPAISESLAKIASSLERIAKALESRD